jgi:putative ABC transport system permease protein
MLALAALLGVLVTLAAALGPARRAARVSPLDALRESSAPRGAGRGRIVAGTATLVLAAGALAVAVRDASTLPLALGGILVLAGMVVVGPAIVGPLLLIAGRMLPPGWVPGTLARESAARSPRRTSATAMALAIGLALISFMAVLSASVKASMGVVSADAITDALWGEDLPADAFNALQIRVSKLRRARVAAGAPSEVLRPPPSACHGHEGAPKAGGQHLVTDGGRRTGPAAASLHRWHRRSVLTGDASERLQRGRLRS